MLDLPAVTWELGPNALSIERGVIDNLRYGQYQSDTSRVVLDVNAPVAIKKAFLLPPEREFAYRLVIDLEPVPTELFRQSMVRLAGPEPIVADGVDRAALHPVSTRSPQVSPARAAADPDATTAAALQQTIERSTAAIHDREHQLSALQFEELRSVPQAPDQPPTTGATEAMLAPPPPPPPPRPKRERLIVVIDAGHGGQDPGATSRKGLLEKNITLAAARELKKILQDRYQVVMTRKKDVYVSLSDRVEIARQAKANLFVSLHADKHENKRVRGASVYTLSEKASDAEAEDLAQRENKADIVAGVDLSEGYDAEVTQILISLVQQSTMNCSATFATLLVPEIGKRTKLLRRTHRFAGFRVLKAPDVPSVLLELGYLSNNQDEQILSEPTRRKKLMRSIRTAIDSYFSASNC